MKINMNEIGEVAWRRLRKVREMLGYTRGQMAARLEIKRGTYYKNENGETLPSWKTLYFLQKEYDISVDWMMLNNGPMHVKEKIPNSNENKEQKKEQKLAPEVQKDLKDLKDFNALKNKLPELEKMLKMMADDPELQHDMLRNFHKYQKNAATTKE